MPVIRRCLLSICVDISLYRIPFVCSSNFFSLFIVDFLCYCCCIENNNQNQPIQMYLPVEMETDIERKECWDTDLILFSFVNIAFKCRNGKVINFLEITLFISTHGYHCDVNFVRHNLFFIFDCSVSFVWIENYNWLLTDEVLCDFMMTLFSFYDETE